MLKRRHSHEFTGIVNQVGAEVKYFKIGDHVVSPFTVSWSDVLVGLHLS